MLSKCFEVKQVTEVADLIQLGKDLNNGASVESNAIKYLAEGKIYFATNRTNSALDLEKLLDEKVVKYMIYVKDNKMVGGPHFSSYDVKFVGKEDAKEITQLLIDSNEIELDRIAQDYLDFK